MTWQSDADQAITSLRASKPGGRLRFGYARVSTGDQHPEGQVDRLKEAGCDYVLVDRGVSGTKADRPRWNYLRKAVKDGDEVVAVKLDRIARSTRNLLDVVQEFTDGGVALRMLDQPIDTGPFGMLVLTILGAIATFEHDLIVERTLDGQNAVRAMGNLRRSFGGDPPLGFRDPGGSDDRDWELDPQQGDYLRAAADKVLPPESMPLERAYRALPVMHDSTGRKVTLKMLRSALTRPASAGLIVDVTGKVVATAAIGGPLDTTTHMKLRHLYDDKKTGRPAQGRYPLGPALRCGKCGNILTGTQYKPRDRNNKLIEGATPVRYYACANPHKGIQDRPCRRVSVPAEELEALVADSLAEWEADPRFGQVVRRRQPGYSVEHEAIEAKIAEYNRWKSELWAERFRRRHAMSAVDFEMRRSEIEQMIEEAEDELDALEAATASDDDVPWEQATPAAKLARVEDAFELPITVAYLGRTSPRKVTTADRITLKWRDPSR